MMSIPLRLPLIGLLIFNGLLNGVALAQSPATVPGSSPQAKAITVAMGFSMEPYVLNNGRGIVGDLIRESLAKAGFSVRFQYYSNVNAHQLYEDGASDAVGLVKLGMVGGYYSAPIVTFTNRLINVSKNGVPITELAELQGLRVVGFSNARGYLGEAFAEQVSKARDYREINSQEQQVAALFKGEADVIVADVTIFEYYQKRLINALPNSGDYRGAVTYGYAFPQRPYHIAFRDEQQQQAFDAGFKQLQASGRVEQIYKQYRDLLDRF